MRPRRAPASRSARAASLRRRIRRPPAHWTLLAFCLGVLVVLLTVQGLSVRTTGASRTPDARSSGSLRGDAAVLAAGPHGLRAHQGAAGRRVALTFDDGPDPRRTPRIASFLRRAGAPATFFLVGSQVVRHPGIVRGLRHDGFELGNHTFTHVDLARTPAWERDLQISMTESAIAGAAGVRTRLVRPPYSSTPDAVTARQARAYADVARQGYVLTLSNLDGRDWGRPGAAGIPRSVTPRGRDGGILLLHDGGGDRTQTLRALRRLVPELRARGFTFTTVSRLAALDRRQAEPRADGWQRARGELLTATLAVARGVTGTLGALLVAIAILAVIRATALLALARRHRRTPSDTLADPAFAPPVSIVVPAYNEAAGIERAVRSLAGSDYPDLEVVVVDDGSVDGTADLVERLELSCVEVLRQPNAGKAAALNRGIAHAVHELVVTVDADTVFEPGTLRRLLQPFGSADVGAVPGTTKSATPPG